VQHVEIPKILAQPGSPHHNSLATYLEYAKRVDLKPTSTVFVGTYYEYVTALSLLRLGFSLFRIGGRADMGIDLIGHWVLPQFLEPMPVIVQCKVRHNTMRCNPVHVRELRGALQGVPDNWKGKEVLALLVSSTNASTGVLDALKRQRQPMGFLNISRQGDIQQFVWNHAASERGLEGLGVTLRHTPLPPTKEPDVENSSVKRSKKVEAAGTKRDVVLTWMGTPIFPERETPHEETEELMRQIAADDRIALKKKKKPTEETVAIVVKGRGRPPGRTVAVAIQGRVKGRAPGRPPGAKNKKTLAREAAEAARRMTA
jgi:hypothetical protein